MSVRNTVPWSLQEVLLLHIIRIIISFCMIKAATQLFHAGFAFLAEFIDRSVIISLVLFTLKKHNTTLQEWGLIKERAGKDAASGILCGIVLYSLSAVSQHIFATMLFSSLK